MRQTYAKGELDEAAAGDDPLDLFGRWFAQAQEAGETEPNAMTLATVGENGRPSTRVVLAKVVDERGIAWFTGYESRKGRELATNPYAAVQFYWPGLERVVRVEGPVARVAAEESDAYFAMRPLGSRIGAWASPQSQVVASRAELAERERQAAAELGEDPPRPPHWGGFRLTPETWEFWQGRPSRLHDRIRFSREGDGWARCRLAP